MPRAGPRAGDGEVFDTLAAPQSLADHLLGQLAVLPLPPRDFTLAAAVVGSLEEDGYLRTPLEEVGQASQLLPAADAQELRIAQVRGRWTAVLNDAVVPRVRLNERYAQLFQHHRSAGHGELGAQLQEARWTVRNIELRFSTIGHVAQAILKRQQQFLAYGAMAMKPLALREVAREVGVHESTVSRVTHNTFMATPCGVFELKYFFSRGLATAAGGQISPTAIRGLIRELIASETPGQPLPDVDLARQLDGQGLKVARRTVTNYRQLLRIEPAERRRGRTRAAAAPEPFLLEQFSSPA